MLKADSLRSNEQLCDRIKFDVSGINSNCMDIQLTTVYLEGFVSSIISFNDSKNTRDCCFNEKKVETIYFFFMCAVD